MICWDPNCSRLLFIKYELVELSFRMELSFGCQSVINGILTVPLHLLSVSSNSYICGIEKMGLRALNDFV